MPRIFDNITQKLNEALLESLKIGYRADFCVGYFNLRGWRMLQPVVDTWDGTKQGQGRVLVGM